MLIDLQLHSTYSDGYLTPTQLVKFISGQGIKVASLTDHNTVSGLYEFRRACKKFDIKAITGIELYVKYNNKRFNLLWFNFKGNDPDFHKVLRDSQIRRRGMVRRILKKLKKKGFKIEINKILDKYTHYTPINHIVDDIFAIPSNQAIIRRELKCKNPREGEIIKEYFRNEKTIILRESYINIEKILNLRKKIGGQLILNHPGKHHRLNKEFLKEIKKLGIDGIELLSPHHSIGVVMYIQFLARELDFITTGGSDFHRFEGSGHFMQSAFDYFKIDSKYLRKIKKIIK